MLKLVMVVFVAALLAGCSTSERITMVKGEETRVCGPYLTGGNINGAAMVNQRKLESCASDYRSQGFVRK